MTILVSNDDGILAPGLLALAMAARDFDEVVVVGPEENQSANGHRKTLWKPLRVNPVNLGSRITAYSVDGSPADCIAVAHLGIVKDIKMVVSGINRGGNMGQDLTYSGTVAAAFEGTLSKIPSVAFSLENSSLNADYSTSAEVARHVIRQTLDHGLPPMTLLNVNIPYVKYNELQGYRITRQGVRVYHDKLDARKDPRGEPYYWIAGEAPTGDYTRDDTDVYAVYHNYVSISPIHLDLTAYGMMESLSGWKF